MKICEQTVKPHARYLPHLRVWLVRCEIASATSTTLDDALKTWRATRLSYQLNYPWWCK